MAKTPPRRLHTSAARRHRARMDGRMDRPSYVQPIYDEEEEDDQDDQDDAEGDLFDALPTVTPPTTPQDSQDSGDTTEMTAARYLALRSFDLPSGGMVRLRRYSLLNALKAGTLPNALVAVAHRALGDGQAPGKTRATTTEDMFALCQFLTMQLVASFRVVDRPEGAPLARDEVPISLIDDSDVLAIGAFALAGQEALRSFRR